MMILALSLISAVLAVALCVCWAHICFQRNEYRYLNQSYERVLKENANLKIDQRNMKKELIEKSFDKGPLTTFLLEQRLAKSKI